MHAVSAVAPDTTNSIVVPLLVTIALATLVLAVVAVYVRRLRTSHRLNAVNGGASAASAAMVLAIALFVSVSLGEASIAAAQVPVDQGPVASTPAATQLPATNDLDGLQLPTK